MLNGITNGISTAVKDTVTAPTTVKNMITDTLKGATSTIIDGLSNSSSLSLLDPSFLLSLTNLLTLAASLLQYLQNILENPAKFIVTPLLRLLRPFKILAISVLLFLIGVAVMITIIFSPLIIVSSPVWVPTAMVLLFVSAGLLITSVSIVVILTILLRVMQPWVTIIIQRFKPIGQDT